MKRIVAIILTVLFFCASFSFSVCAEPTDAFTHVEEENGQYKSIAAREMYRSTKVLRASTYGLKESFMGISDIAVDENENVYLLLGERSSIVVLNPDYSYNRTVTIKDEEDYEVDFNMAQGLFVEKGTGDLYICDTNNAQIIVADKDGNLKTTIQCPDTPLIDETSFMPYRLVKDNDGYMYVISQGCVYGALSYDPEGNFLGFYGANIVKASALDTLSFLWDKLTKTDAKKSYSAKTIPSAFVDLALDSDGYMVTCTSMLTDEDLGSGQIRKLSPGGGDILYKRATDGTSQASNSFNFLESKVVKQGKDTRKQDLGAIDTDESDFIYALDRTFGLIYVYDSECNLLGGFGGLSKNPMRKGMFYKPVSLAVKGDAILVADVEEMSVTVFEATDYGKCLKAAQSAYIKGDYEGSKELWNKVLAYDAGNQLAFRGLAMVALTEENYELALDYAKKGLDYSVYDLAWQKVLAKRVSDYFAFIFIGFILVTGGIIALFVVLKKKNKVLISNIKVKTALRCSIHPFDSFNDIKYKGYGSVRIAVVLSVLLYIGKMLQKTAAGFLFMKSAPQDYNMFVTVLTSAGIVLIWSVSNWLVACLSDGKGKFKEIYIATNYALIPYIIYTYISVIASHFVSLTGIAILNGISTAVLLFTFFLIAIAIMTVNEYDFFKFLGTAIVSILFIVLMAFVVVLVVTLSQQIIKFFTTIFTEMFYR